MAKYLLVCDSNNSSSIFLTNNGTVRCKSSDLQLVEYKPNLSDLTFSQSSELITATAFIFALAWILQKLIKFIFNK